MLKHRTLNDLYVVETPITIDDGKGEVQLWLRKLDPLDLEEAKRAAAADRARTRVTLRDEDSDEYLAMQDELADYEDTEALISVCLHTEQSRKVEAVEAELAMEAEWADEGYLQGLRDTWADGLGDRWQENHDDPEAARVWAELQRFATQVTKAIEGDMEARRRVLSELPEEDLRKRAFDELVKLRLDMVWYTSLGRWELFYGTRKAVPIPAAERESDQDESATRSGGRYFESIESVRRLDPQVYLHLRQAYQQMLVPMSEGKDSPATPASSPSSAPSDQEETSTSSGHLEPVP